MMPKKTNYRVRNWRQYNKALMNRGSITVWISEEIANNLTKRRAEAAHGNQVYSDTLIELCLTLRQVYGRPLRATQGLVQSIFTLMKLKAPVPNYTTLSRRAKKLTIKLKARPNPTGRTILVDSTGVQVIGGTEWKKMRYKKQGRQLWRKLHVAIDAASQDICAALVTQSQNLDGNYMAPLLEQISSDVKTIIGDGAYDKKSCYETAFKRNARPVFPPQHNASVQRNKVNKHIPLTARDELIMYLNGGKSRRNRLTRWKKKSGYHQRSLVETTMSRLKYVFGDRVRSRVFENQVTDLMIRCAIMNKMNKLGLPDSVIAA